MKNHYSLVYALVICLHAFQTNAQTTPFIEVLRTDQIPRTSEFRIYEAAVKGNPNVVAYHFVHLNPLATSQRDGIMKIDLPGSKESIVAEASQVKYHSETEYEWYGKTDEDRGNVIILANEGRVTVSITTPKTVCEIFPAPGGVHCLRIMDLWEASSVGCVSTSPPKEPALRTNTPPIHQPALGTNAKLYPCQPVVNPRVLVLYTPKALAAASSEAVIKDFANQSVAQFNTCIYNSGISSNAALILAGVAPLNFAETTMEADRTSLPNNPTAKSLRDQYQADLVVLFTDGPSLARGATADPLFNNDKAYAIVQIVYALSSKTFAHEVGHLFGCYHDNENPSPQYAKAHNIKNGLGIVIDRTVLSTHTTDGINRLLNFSNPNINVGGKPTGTAAGNDNARRISETHLAVSNFRPNPPTQLSANINGPTYVTTQGNKLYELDYSCGSAPYSFVWQYSYDGINYTTSNVTTETFSWPFYQNQKIYLKGTVKTNAVNATAFIAITAQMPSPYRQSVSSDSSFSSSSQLFISPNPADNNIQIHYSSFDKNILIELLNEKGISLQEIDHVESPKIGKLYSIRWKCDHLTPGTYYIRLATGKDKIVKRFIRK